MSIYKYVDTSLGLKPKMTRLRWPGDAHLAAHSAQVGELPAKPGRSCPIIDEIIDSATRLGTKLFMFFDDTFTVHRERAAQLFEALIHKKRQGLLSDVHFSGFTRANSLDTDLLRLEVRGWLRQA